MLLFYKPKNYQFMKKVFAVMAILSLFAQSCKKDAPVAPVETVIYTDTPPRDMFDDGQYLSTYRVYIETADTDSATKKGYGCFYDNNTGQQRDCSQWYLLSAKKYWGIFQGKVYVSKSKNWYVLQANVVLDAENNAKKKGAAIGYTCDGCNHPFNNFGWINGIEN